MCRRKTNFPSGAKIKTQGAWLNIVKTGGCVAATGWARRAHAPSPKKFTNEFQKSADAWARRIQSGGAQAQMARDIGSLDPAKRARPVRRLDERIAKGELPFAKPDGPKGIARNVVITRWDWGRPTAYLHDEVSTDRRNPRINANGKLYGSPENSTDMIPILDPAHQDRKRSAASGARSQDALHQERPFAPSAFWGDKPIWDSQTMMHNPMMDEKGRVWSTPRIRPDANPAFCKDGSDHPSAKAFPLEESGRQLSMYDPASGKFTLIDTCFSTHHLNFASDANNTLWLSPASAGRA